MSEVMRVAQEWGYFTGKYTLSVPIEQRIDYPWMLNWRLTRWLGKMLTTAIYVYNADPIEPCTFHCRPDNGPEVEIQPNKHFVTDMGSIPKALDWLFPKDRFNYFPHDSGYEERGLWIRRKAPPIENMVVCVDKDNNFSFLPATALEYSEHYRYVPLEREVIDRLLMCQVGAGFGNAFQRGMVFQAVHLFGAGTWKKRRVERVKKGRPA